MVRTYIVGMSFKFKKSPKDAYGYIKMEKVGKSPISDKTDHYLVFVQEMARLRKVVVGYDTYGYGIRDLDTGKVMVEGSMSEEVMERMDEELKLSEGVII